MIAKWFKSPARVQHKGQVLYLPSLQIPEAGTGQSHAYTGSGVFSDSFS